MESNLCEYSECYEEAKVFNEELESWLCDKHDCCINNPTGYCGRNCMLGYGCDDSC